MSEPKSQWEQFLAAPIVRAGAFTIDLSDLKPLTIANKKALKRDADVTMASLKDDDPEQEAKLVLFFLRLINPDVKIEDVDQMAAQDAQFVQRFVARRAQEVDRPTSARSMPSPAPTDGHQQN